MRSSTGPLSHYENNFSIQRPTLSIFVKTNDSTRQLVVCCRRDEMIKNVCKTIANIYFKTFMSEDCSDDSDDGFGDYYYQNSENDSVIVEHLEFDGYVLPALHKIGDLLENKVTVTAKIVLTGKPTHKGSRSKPKSKTVVKKEEKEKKPKVKKEPMEKKPKQAKTKIKIDSDDSLEAPIKKVKPSGKKSEQESKMEKMEEVKLDMRQSVRHDDSDSSIEEMIVEPRMWIELPAKKKPVAVAKKSPQKKESVKKQKPKPAKEEIIIDESESDNPIELPPQKNEPAKLQPSKTIILAGMTEKYFGEDTSSEDEVVKPKMQVEPTLTKKPEAAVTTTTTQAQPGTKTSRKESKNEEKSVTSKITSRLDSADLIELSEIKENVPETQKPKETTETKIVEVQEKLDETESEDEVKPVEKPKMQVEPPAPPATQEMTQTMKPPAKKIVPIQDLKKNEKPKNLSDDDSDEVPSPKKNVPVQDAKKNQKPKNLSDDDSDEVPSPKKNGTIEQNAKPKPKVVVSSVIAKYHPQAGKVTDKIQNKEVIELLSPSTDKTEEIVMTQSAQVVAATLSRKIISINEQVKPLLEEDSPAVFKIHGLIDSDDERKSKAESKKTKKAKGKGKGKENQAGKAGQQNSQDTFMEDLSASLKKLVKKPAVNGKGKNKASAKGAKGKESLSSSFSSESEVIEIDMKKSQRNVNLFQ